MMILNHHHINGHILQAVDRETDAILLLESAGRASFLYLRNLSIPPPRGYEIVCRGWAEFHLSETDFSGPRLFQVNLTL